MSSMTTTLCVYVLGFGINMQGLQVFDEQGVVTLDVTDRITKILGEVIIPKEVEQDTGSVVDPELALGTPFFFCVGNEALKDGYVDPKGWHHGFWRIANSGGSVGFYPGLEIPAYDVQVSFDGTTMNWSVSKYAKWWVTMKNTSFSILYGVY